MATTWAEVRKFWPRGVSFIKLYVFYAAFFLFQRGQKQKAKEQVRVFILNDGEDGFIFIPPL